MRDLNRALGRNDVEAVVDWFRGRNEKERREVAGDVADFLQKHPVWNDTSGAAVVAGYACLSLGQIRKLWLSPRGRGEAVAAVLADRRPSWLPSLVGRMLGDEFSAGEGFAMARRLMHAGVLERPESPDYLVAMTAVPWGRPGRDWSVYECLLTDEALIDHELWDLLADEGAVNRLASWGTHPTGWVGAIARLSAEGRIDRQRLLDVTLDGFDRDFTPHQVRFFGELHEVLEVTLDEKAAREARYLGLLGNRLGAAVTVGLEAVGALLKAKRANPAALVDAIEPALLSDTKKNAVAALRLLDRCLKQHAELRGRGVLVAATATGHARMDVQELALSVIGRHLDHGDVATRAELAARATLIDASLVDRLGELVGITAAPAAPTPGQGADVDADSLVRRAAAVEGVIRVWSGLDEALARFERGGPPASFDLDASVVAELRVKGASTVTPAKDVAELVELVGAVLAGSGAAEDVDRALDGLARFAPDFRVAPGVAGLQAQAAVEPLPYQAFHGQGPRADMAGVVSAVVTKRLGSIAGAVAPTPAEWLESARRPHLHRGGPALAATAAGFHSARCYEVARAVLSGWCGPLLSLPTHAGGWIAPGPLVDRVLEAEARRRRPLHFDVIQALLRLGGGAETRRIALARLPAGGGELVDATRHALGAEGVRVGRTEAWWLAAARARQADGDDEVVGRRHGRGVPGGASAARIGLTLVPAADPGPALVPIVEPPPPVKTMAVDAAVPSWVRSLAGWRPHLYAWGDTSSHGWWDGALIRCAGSAWPGGRLLLDVMATVALAEQVNEDRRESLATWLERHLDADEPFTPPAFVALVCGLGAKDVVVRTTAVDVVVAAVSDGRLTVGRLGPVVQAMLRDQLVAAARLAKSLGEVGRVSRHHGLVVIDAIEATWTAERRRDAHALLEVALSLRAEHAVGVPEGPARVWLAGFSGSSSSSSKAAKLASKVLAVPTAPDGAIDRELCAQAVVAALRRAERYSV